jgi:Lrp/AsnC family transcriptional regulator for asnA, asnC and gidA
MSLDKLDLMLMEELENDASQPVRALARKLGMKRTTVAYHLNRLRAERILTIACVCNPELLGYQFLLVIGINVSSGKADAVASQLVPLPEVKVVSLAAGRYSIMAWALLRDRSALAHFVSEYLAKISDITAVEMIHSYQWVRDSWRYFKPQIGTLRRYPRDNPSDLDLSIAKAMELDPRQTITKLARTVGCSKSVAKTSLEKLLNDGIIRVVSIIDPAALGYDVGVVILIKTTPDKVYAVANELSMQHTARHVSLITGQWQIFVAAQFLDSGHMHNFLSETLTSIPGVMEFEVVHLVKTLKFSISILGSD